MWEYSAAILAFCLALITVTFGYWSRYKYSYFKRLNIPYIKPRIPWGNLSAIGGHTNLIQWTKDMYFSFRDKHPFMGGIFIGFEPVIVVTDLNLMKIVLATNFSSFTDRGFFMNERDDTLSTNLFSLPGQRWRHMRTKISPTFSSFNIKNMFETVHVIGWDLLQFMEQNSVITQKPFNAKYLAMRFICDSIGSCGFGLDCRAFSESDPYLLKIAENLFPASKHLLAHWFLTGIYDRLSRFLRLRVFPKNVTDYFTSIIDETVKYREENRIVRKDFLNLLMQIKDKGCLTEDESGEVLGSISYTDLQAQAFVIFFAGFHTSRVALSFALFELAVNVSIQERLRDEIMSKLPEDGQLTYDALEEMTYLQQVINETLRKYPPQPFLQRVATTDLRLPGKNYQVKKGHHVHIPLIGVHYDPSIYPEPDRFDPDRMTKEGMKARHPCSFMPFGYGPRICVGYRFALLQVKMGIAMILSKYRLTINSKTKQPLNFLPNRIDLDVEDGIWLNAQNL